MKKETEMRPLNWILLVVINGGLIASFALAVMVAIKSTWILTPMLIWAVVAVAYTYTAALTIYALRRRGVID